MSRGPSGRPSSRSHVVLGPASDDCSERADGRRGDGRNLGTCGPRVAHVKSVKAALTCFDASDREVGVTSQPERRNSSFLSPLRDVAVLAIEVPIKVDLGGGNDGRHRRVGVLLAQTAVKELGEVLCSISADRLTRSDGCRHTMSGNLVGQARPMLEPSDAGRAESHEVNNAS